jgi:uncharacterized protein (DUF924 family)
METPDTIHQFWFGTDSDDARVAEEKSHLWWMKNPQTDREIRARFLGTLEQAARSELRAWLESARGRLALILLTDQFPRNIFRDTPRAFEFDHLARNWCVEGLDAGVDAGLRPIERVFFCLPLEHSESAADQERAVSLFQALHDEVAETDEAHRSTFAGFLDYAHRHREVIARFGRFPHRNRILGRASTAEEAAFLLQPGSSF